MKLRAVSVSLAVALTLAACSDGEDTGVGSRETAATTAVDDEPPSSSTSTSSTAESERGTALGSSAETSATTIIVDPINLNAGLHRFAQTGTADLDGERVDLAGDATMLLERRDEALVLSITSPGAPTSTFTLMESDEGRFLRRMSTDPDGDGAMPDNGCNYADPPLEWPAKLEGELLKLEQVECLGDGFALHETRKTRFTVESMQFAGALRTVVVRRRELTTKNESGEELMRSVEEVWLDPFGQVLRLHRTSSGSGFKEDRTLEWTDGSS